MPTGSQLAYNMTSAALTVQSWRQPWYAVANAVVMWVPVTTGTNWDSTTIATTGSQGPPPKTHYVAGDCCGSSWALCLRAITGVARTP